MGIAWLDSAASFHNGPEQMETQIAVWLGELYFICLTPISVTATWFHGWHDFAVNGHLRVQSTDIDAVGHKFSVPIRPSDCAALRKADAVVIAGRR